MTHLQVFSFENAIWLSHSKEIGTLLPGAYLVVVSVSILRLLFWFGLGFINVFLRRGKIPLSKMCCLKYQVRSWVWSKDAKFPHSLPLRGYMSHWEPRWCLPLKLTLSASMDKCCKLSGLLPVLPCNSVSPTSASVIWSLRYYETYGIFWSRDIFLLSVVF